MICELNLWLEHKGRLALEMAVKLIFDDKVPKIKKRLEHKLVWFLFDALGILSNS